MEIPGWYNDLEYSDLTLKLSDGREIKVHKIVICKNNEFFRRLCGHGSKSAESSQRLITLEHDDADAVEEVLRKIYGCTLEDAKKRSWQYWSNLVVTADKFSEPKLSKDASENFRTVAREEKDANVIFDIITTIKRDMGHSRSLLEFSESLRKANLDKLLVNKRYRQYLDVDKNLMWSQIDELRAAAGLVQRYSCLCPDHREKVFSQTAWDHARTCTWCFQPATLEGILVPR